MINRLDVSLDESVIEFCHFRFDYVRAWHTLGFQTRTNRHLSPLIHPGRLINMERLACRRSCRRFACEPIAAIVSGSWTRGWRISWATPSSKPHRRWSSTTWRATGCYASTRYRPTSALLTLCSPILLSRIIPARIPMLTWATWAVRAWSYIPGAFTNLGSWSITLSIRIRWSVELFASFISLLAPFLSIMKISMDNCW